MIGPAVISALFPFSVYLAFKHFGIGQQSAFGSGFGHSVLSGIARCDGITFSDITISIDSRVHYDDKTVALLFPQRLMS